MFFSVISYIPLISKMLCTYSALLLETSCGNAKIAFGYLAAGKDSAMSISKGRKRKGPNYLHVLAMLTLIAAWWFGSMQETSVLQLLKEHYSSAEITANHEEDLAYSVLAGDEYKTVYIAEGKGYGGPLVVGFTLNETDLITKVELLSHVDTPGYVGKVNSQGFYRQFEGKKISNSLIVGHDIDGVSGATLTSEGITDAVRVAAHNVAVQHGLAQSWPEKKLRLQIEDIVLAMLVLLALLERYIPTKQRKYHLMFMGTASVVFIGYWINASLSLSALSSLALGYVPDLDVQFSLYILLFGVIFGIVQFGKNIYCSILCPFHHIQRLAYKIGENNWPISKFILKNSVNFVNFLLWLSLVLIFISRNPTIGSYEPFSMLFSLEGVGVQWYVFPLALIGSLFVKDFWCRLFCPVGRCLTIATARRNKLNKYIKSQIPIKVVNNQ